jgi:hypothetical protein
VVVVPGVIGIVVRIGVMSGCRFVGEADQGARQTRTGQDEHDTEGSRPVAPSRLHEPSADRA